MSPQHQHQQGRYQHSGRGGQQSTGADRLPDPQPVRYHSDDAKKQLKPELVDDEAHGWARRFSDLKSTQMRRFYDEFKAIERKILSGRDLQEQEANFQRDRALIMMFKAKAVYAEKRRVSPPAFTEFIFNHMASIKDLRDFQAFIKVFEAVVAYHRYYAKDN